MIEAGRAGVQRGVGGGPGATCCQGVLRSCCAAAAQPQTDRPAESAQVFNSS